MSSFSIKMHKFRFQVISDIHLEFMKGKIPQIIPKCSTLVLAGDIGNPMLESYGRFLRKCANDFQNIILIHGNHEYYGTNYKTSTEKTREICAEINKTSLSKKIHFLNNSHVDIEGYRFIGSTLWTKLPPNIQLIGDRNINDFSINWYNKMHAECYDYLTVAISDTVLPTIVVTHHLPSLSLIAPKYHKYGDINLWFASESDELISFNSKVKAWIYGHTHDACASRMGEVKLLCNPLGYPGENPEKDDITVMVEL